MLSFIATRPLAAAVQYIILMRASQVLLAVLNYCDHLSGALLRLFNKRETTSNEVQHWSESSGGVENHEDLPATQPEGETGGLVLRRLQTFSHHNQRSNHFTQSVELQRVFSETSIGQKTSCKTIGAESTEQNDSVQLSCTEVTKQ